MRLALLFADYNCNNPECIKVVDPADEAANLLTEALELIIVGESFFAVTAFLCCCFGVTAVRAATGKRF